MNNIIEPLRLAVGSHEAGSGKGCAMTRILIPAAVTNRLETL